MNILEKFFKKKEEDPVLNAILASAGQKVIQEQGQGLYGAPELYLILEDEKTNEFLRFARGLAARDIVLSVFDDRDIEWLYWQTRSLSTLTYMVAGIRNPSDMVRELVYKAFYPILLSINLEIWGFARAKRGYYGFERRLEQTRYSEVRVAPRGERR